MGSCIVRGNLKYRHSKILLPHLIREIASWNDHNYNNSSTKISIPPLKPEEGEERRQNEEKILSQSSSSRTHPYKSLFPWKSKKDLVRVLCENIIYSKGGLIAINKPFGVGVVNVNQLKSQSKTLHTKREINDLHIRGIGESPYVLHDVLPLLKTELNAPNLKLLKSTGKYSSGIAVFSVDEKYAEMYSHSLRVTKPYPLYNYSIVSVNIPTLHEEKVMERVGIKQQAHPLTDIRQPVIVRTMSKNAVERNEVSPVSTSLRILSRSRPNVVLLELKTSSVKWNFLQIYCADMLAPILGDHLFSSRVQTMMGVPTKIHPVHLVPGSVVQKLSKPLLESLKLISENDALIVPTHIHLSSLTLKRYGKEKETVIQAPLCQYFKWTCDTLNLTVPSDTL